MSLSRSAAGGFGGTVIQIVVHLAGGKTDLICFGSTVNQAVVHPVREAERALP